LAGQSVSQVRITSGQGVAGAAVNEVSDGGLLDVVVFDDFVYSEPRSLAIYLPIVVK
jgi:hypothetical protein